MVNYKEKVAKGVEWLNKNHSGWKREINVSILDMNQFDLCILGQLFESYSKAEKFLGENFCVEHGFKYSDNAFGNDNHINNRLLDKEWEAVLEETFNLSEVKVKPGLYEIVDNYGANITFKNGSKILVITTVSSIDISVPCYEKIINTVVSPSDFTLYVNCPIIVKRVKEST